MDELKKSAQPATVDDSQVEKVEEGAGTTPSPMERVTTDGEGEPPAKLWKLRSEKR